MGVRVCKLQSEPTGTCREVAKLPLAGLGWTGWGLLSGDFDLRGVLRLAECPFWDYAGQETAEIMRRSTHDAAAQVLSPGCGFGRSAGRTRFENVSSFRVFRTRQDTDRAELSSASV